MRENIENGLIFNLKGDTIFLKINLTLSILTKLQETGLFNCGQLMILLFQRIKKLFLNESFYGKNNLYPKKDFFQVLPRGFESGFNKEDAVALFSKNAKLNKVPFSWNGR